MEKSNVLKELCLRRNLTLEMLKMYHEDKSYHNYLVGRLEVFEECIRLLEFSK